jgi:hypothetical protein
MTKAKLSKSAALMTAMNILVSRLVRSVMKKANPGGMPSWFGSTLDPNQPAPSPF